MSAHDRLKAEGITPTIDAERAYRLGVEDGRDFEGDLNDELLRKEDRLQAKIARLEQMLTEIGLMARRAR